MQDDEIDGNAVLVVPQEDTAVGSTLCCFCCCCRFHDGDMTLFVVAKLLVEAVAVGIVVAVENEDEVEG